MCPRSHSKSKVAQAPDFPGPAAPTTGFKLWPKKVYDPVSLHPKLTSSFPNGKDRKGGWRRKQEPYPKDLREGRSLGRLKQESNMGRLAF